ncbi:MAG: hypothetical protein ACU0AT_12925 [Tranquillimonas sp.]
MMTRFITLISSLFTAGFAEAQTPAVPSTAKESVQAEIIDRLNEALREDGVIFSVPEGAQTGVDWAPLDNVSSQFRYEIPEYGIAAVGPTGRLEGLFGPSAPVIMKDAQTIGKIAGFDAPAGTEFKIVPADQYATLLAASETQLKIDRGVQKAVQSFRQISSYVADMMCQPAGRPSTITLSLDAEFKLVFGGSTGAEAVWQLDTVCPRMGYE